jgi:hypothetical protein
MKRVFPDRKRLFPVFAIIVLALLAGGLANAQSDPFVATWKLNVEKSKYEPGPAPKSQTRTWDASGKVTVQGIDASGNPREYGYVVTNDGKGAPTTGAIPSGADTAVTKRVSERKIQATFTKGGKTVESTEFTVSPDGKAMTIDAKGTLANGKEFSTVSIWEKQ